MLTDSILDRRAVDRTPSERTDRGQVILIGAIALAFIILGVVVVFNGVVYTETLSSAETSQSASTADRTELEIKQGISCLLAEYDGETTAEGEETIRTSIENDIEEYEGLYQNSTAYSRPTAVSIDVDPTVNVIGNTIHVDHVTTTITYDSNDVSYERTMEINAGQCQ